MICYAYVKSYTRNICDIGNKGKVERIGKIRKIKGELGVYGKVIVAKLNPSWGLR